MKKTEFSKIIALVLSLLMLACVFSLAGCAQQAGTDDTATPAAPAEETAVPTEAAAAKGKVALVLNGNISDGGWSQQPYEALVQAGKDFDLDIAYTEQVPANEAVQVMKTYAEDGYNLILSNDSSFTDALLEVSAQYPDTMFVGCNQPEVGDNLMCARLDYAINGTLSAIVMGDFTKTKKVGFIAAMQTAHVDSTTREMRKKLAEIDPAIELQVVYSGDWYDVNKAKQAAVALLDGGCDVVANSIAGAITAVAQEAKARGCYAIGWTGDDTDKDPDTILVCVLESNYKVFYYAIQACMVDGQYKPGDALHFGLKEDAVGAGTFGNAVTQATKDKVMAEVEGIKNGTIVVDTSIEGWH
ncbi:MAG: BMP family protein [Bacillota bacterium]